MASELISQAEYARRRGVSPQAVSLAVRAGRIPTSRGKINRRAADRAWRANTDQAKPRNSVNGQPRAVRTNGKATSYAANRASRELYQAKITRMEYEELMGQLVRVDVVRATWFRRARQARDLVLAIPDRLAPVLAACSDAFEVQRILAEELRRACEELNREPETR